jgi:predicted MPP superfamily phosphohydrolase
MIIAQITDLHVRPRGVLAYGGLDTTAMLGRAMTAIAALDPAPDCVIATGDLADCGLADEYRMLDELFAQLSMPVFAIPGNHDRRDAMRAALAAATAISTRIRIFSITRSTIFPCVSSRSTRWFPAKTADKSVRREKRGLRGRSTHRKASPRS